MPLDASIPLRATNQSPDPLDAAAKIYTLKAAKQQADMGDMQLHDTLSLRRAAQDPDVMGPNGEINFSAMMSSAVKNGVSPTALLTLSKASEEQRSRKIQRAQAEQQVVSKVRDDISQTSAALLPQINELAKSVGIEAAVKQFEPQLTEAHARNDSLLKSIGKNAPPLDMSNPMRVYQGIQAAAGMYKPMSQSESGKLEETKRHNAVTEAAAAKKAKATEGFEGRNGELMGALAERGISLPTGFRSKEQQIGLLNSLWKRNSDLSADQIADKVKTGQIDLANVKKAGQVAAGIAGKISYAENEIEQTIPLVREASSKLPRGQFVPWNKLKQMTEAQLSDPNLAEFKMYMTSLSNAYDMLAARGGTDKEKRAENRKNFDTATSPEALERVLQAVRNEAKASGRAAKASMDQSRDGSSPSDEGKKRKPLSEFGGG